MAVGNVKGFKVKKGNETGSGYSPLQGVTHVMFNVSSIAMDLQSLYT